jgi:carbonic anhydrase/acetyltransferase-like protein (isoleucine patch superfamily)
MSGHERYHVSSHDHPTVLEDGGTVGHSVTLHGCYVETGSLIGIGAVLLDGVRIGRESLVAAGSLVTRNADSSSLPGNGKPGQG